MLVQILTEHAIDLFGGRVEQIAGRVHPPGKVDAVVALAMAVERAGTRPEPARVLGWL